MPRAGWWIDGRRVSHEEVMAEARRRGHAYRIPAAVWAALYRQTAREDGWWLSPSQALGCPRLRLLRATEPYWLDPVLVWPQVRGSAYHRAFEDGEHAETTLAMPLRVPLELLDGQRRVVDFPLRGTPDKYDASGRRIIDYKNIEDFLTYDPDRKRRTPRPLPTPAHEAQINLYRLLLHHHGFRVEAAQLWYFSSSHKGGWPRKVIEVPLWDVADAYETAVGAARPLALARETGVLPACACAIPGYGMDRDLCAAVGDREWRGMPDGGA